MGKILIIGGANVDIIAKSREELRKQDSNISKVEISFGGVGRNIVENLARLGHEVHFLTALGKDEFGKSIEVDLRKLNVNLAYTHFSKQQSGLYLAICSPDGEMQIAVCDNDIIQNLNKVYLESCLDYINSFEYLVFDTNLSKDSLDYLFENVQGKIYVDATSVEKAKLLEGKLSKISLLKGNAVEIEALAKKSGAIEEQILVLLSLGIKSVIATQGAGLVYYNHQEKIKSRLPQKSKLVSTTGCGDAFMSGLLHGILRNEEFDNCINYAMLAAAATMLVVGACNPELKKYLEEEK